MANVGAVAFEKPSKPTQGQKQSFQPASPQSGKGKKVSAFWTGQLDSLPCILPMAAALNELPRQRQLSLREHRRYLALNYYKNHQAALGQTRGQIASMPCTRCVKSTGPFFECVTVPGYFAGSCCNCHYSSQGTKCSYRIPRGSAPAGSNARNAGAVIDQPAKLKAEESLASQTRKHDANYPQQHATKEAKATKAANAPIVIDLINEPDRDQMQLHTPQYSPQSPSHKGDPNSPRLGAETRYNKEEIRQPRAQNRGLEEQDHHSKSQNQDLLAEIHRLSSQNSHLIRLITQQHLRTLTVIKNVVASNSVLEAAIDSREAQMRVGLSNLRGTEAQINRQAMQLLDYSNNTTFLVSRLVLAAMVEHQDLISDEEAEVMEKVFNDAEPNQEVAAVMNEKLDFVMDRLDNGSNVDVEHSKSISDEDAMVIETVAEGGEAN